jgi:hypothetical protein
MIAALLAGQALASDTHRYALLVGTNDGGPDRATLRYAHDDARAMEEVLVDLGGVATARSVVLLDPTSTELLQAFDTLADEIGADAARTEVVFYFSGHSDEEGLLLGEEHLPWKEVRTAIEGLGASVRVAILDSCASGSLILAKGGTHVSPFVVDVGTTVEGSAYLTSSSADEVSQEGERVGGSYFTHALRTGLLGAADLSGDGRVTLTEAYAFARDETLQQTERTQHGPQHANYDLQLEGSGELVLTDLSRRSALLVLGEGVAGRVLVRTEDGDLVAELQKAGPQVVELALPAGDYEVAVLPPDADTFGTSPVTLEDGTSSLVGTDDLTFSARESTVARKGGEATSELDRILARFPLDPVREASGGLDTMVIGWLGARSNALDGFGYGTVWYAVDGRASGISTSFGWTKAGDLSGAQLSMLANVATEGSGVQSTVGANVVTRGFDGVQLAVGVNVAGHGTRGAQLAAGANLAPGGLRGLQLSSGFNGAGDRVVGTQIAPVNIAADVGGVQLGVVNGARDVQGTQLAVINAARDVKGVQLGVINVARSVEGIPIGVLSFVQDGRHSVLLGASDADPLGAEFKLGAAFHTGVGVGFWPDRHASVSFTAGVHLTPKPVWVDLDVGPRTWMPIGTALGDRGWNTTTATVAVQGRATLGVQVTPWLAPYVGAGLNVRALDGEVAPSAFGRTDPAVWPTVFGGVQLL